MEESVKRSNSLKKHIVNFAKTKKVCDSYQSAKYKDPFYNDHKVDIALHENAKKAFSELVLKKLPKMAELRENISSMYSEKSELYTEYKKFQEEL